jgi:uncharacterized protein
MIKRITISIHMKTGAGLLTSAIIALGLAISPARASPPLPAAPTYYVLDQSGALSRTELTALETVLIEQDRLTGEQIMIAVLQPSPGGELQDYARELFRAWGIGRSRGDGALLMVDWPKKMAKLETGIGMEGTLPVDRAQSIAEHTVLPMLQRGELSAALGGGVLAVLRATDSPMVSNGKAQQLLNPFITPREAAVRTSWGWIWIPLLLIGLLLTLVALANVMAAEIHYTGTGWLQISPLKLRFRCRRNRKSGPDPGKIGGAYGRW